MIWLSHAAWAILNSIWQGAVVAAIAWLSLRVSRRASAAVRYHVWAAVLIAALVLPVINLLVPVRTIEVAPALAKQPATAPDPVYIVKPDSPAHIIAVDTAPRSISKSAHQSVNAGKASPAAPAASSIVLQSQPHGEIVLSASSPKESTTAPTLVALLASARPRVEAAISAADRAAVAAGQWLQARIAFAFVAWIAIAALLFARLASGLYRLRSIKRGLVRVDDPEVDAMCAAISRRATVATSDEVGSPCVIGYAHPVVALPRALVRTLDGSDLQRVLAHELGHVRRFDDWANLIQQCVRAALFFNPVVHVACRALDVNREIACDDLVAAGHADRIEYAKCLTEIARRGAYVEHLVPAAGFFPDRRQIIVRIEQLLDRDHSGSARVGVVPAASAIGVVIAVAALAAHQLPALAISAPSPSTTANSPEAGTVSATAPRSRVSPNITRSATAPEPEQWSITTRAALDKARSAAARALFEASAKEPALASSDIARLAAARAAFAAARADMAAPRASMAAVVTQAARAQRDAMNAARADLAIAPRVAMIQAARAQLDAVHAASASVAPVARASDQRATEDDFLDALDEAGYKHLSVDDLIAIRNSGVTSAYLHALKEYGISPMPARSLIALANSGVSASTIASMYAAGYRSLTSDDLIALQNAGVSSALVQAAKAWDKSMPSVKDLVALANAGVSSDYISAVAKSGFGKVSVASLIALENAGVSTSYLEDMASEGYGNIGVSDLTALANADVSPSYIRQLADLGYTGLSTNDLIRLADAGVTPKMIKSLRDHGITGKLTVDELIKLADNGF